MLLFIQRQDHALSFYFRGGSGYENILLDISLLDKIFKVLMEGPALRGPVSLVVMERAVVLRSRMSRVV